MLTCIDVRFIFDTVLLRLSSPANIQMSPSELTLSSCSKELDDRIVRFNYYT